MLCSKSCGLILALVVGSSSAFSSNHVHQSPSTKQAASSGGFSPSLSRDLKHSSSLEMVSRSSADIAKGLSKEDPIYDYDLFDSKLPTYTHDVVDVVTGKPKDVFNMAKDWSMDGKFWGTALKLESVKDSGKPDMVDSVRKFEDNGREYREKLLNVDNDNYSFAYGYISGSPPVLKAAVTYCTFEPIEGSDFLTKVTWRVVLQPTFEYPSFVALVKKTQSKAYHGLIDLLKSFFSDQNDKITTNKVAGAATLVVKDIASKINDITSTMVGSTGDEKWEYVEYDGFEDGGLPKHCGTLPASAAIMPKRAGMIFQRNLEFVYSQSPLIGYVFELSNILKDPETIVALSKVPGGPFVHKMVESMVGATIPDQMSIAIELKGLLGSPEATKHLMNTQGKHLIDAVNKLADDPYMSPFIDNESFNWMKEPTQIIENFKKDPESNDLEIAAQLIRGVNPLKITVAEKAEDLPSELRGLSDKSGRSVDELISSKSLFFCDYWEVATGELDRELGVYYNQAKQIGGVGNIGPMKYYYAPKLAIYKNEEGKLDILGFILTTFDDKPNTVYNIESTPPNLYALAKLHLTCADNQQHQFVSHLGMAHLNMEPFAVANHNAFPTAKNGDRHPVGKLLHPHFQDTIGINFLARQTLVSNVAPFTDATFSPGTANALGIFSAAYKKWDFFGDNFPGHLKRRGFDEAKTDGLEGYWYREDGFKLWNAFENHFTRVIDKIYKHDRDVRHDRTLQHWCHEVRDEKLGAMESFPDKFDDKKTLVQAICSIVFYCSAQHASVNFSQRDYVSYLPNRPDNMILPMVDPPAGETDIGADTVVGALPGMAIGEFQSMFSYLLSCPPDNPFNLYDTCEEEFAAENKLFKAELTEIHDEINARNEKLVAAGDVPYPYLDPFDVPQSINI